MSDKRAVQDEKQTAPEPREQDTTERLDETVAGGKYLAADGKTFVDANGEPLKGGKD